MYMEYCIHFFFNTLNYLLLSLNYVNNFFCYQKGEHVPLSIKIGDVVLLPEYGGTKVELDDNKEYHLFRESDILAKVEV